MGVVTMAVESGPDPLQPTESLMPLLRDLLRLNQLIVGFESHLADRVKHLEERVDALADQISAGREE
jgi:hypothetical protein